MLLLFTESLMEHGWMHHQISLAPTLCCLMALSTVARARSTSSVLAPGTSDRSATLGTRLLTWYRVQYSTVQYSTVQYSTGC